MAQRACMSDHPEMGRVKAVTFQIKRRYFFHIIWRWRPPTLEVHGRPWDANFAENERWGFRSGRGEPLVIS